MSISLDDFEEVPRSELREKRGEYVKVVDDFIASGKDVVAMECGSRFSKIYEGLRRASKAEGANGAVSVTKCRTKVYLVRVRGRR